MDKSPYEQYEEAPETKPCHKHPGQLRKKDFDLTTNLSDAPNGKVVIGYLGCPECEKEEAEQEQVGWLVARGVPDNLAHASFENYAQSQEWQKKAVDTCKKFVKAGRGFLFLHGNYGTGKDHLSVSMAREFTGLEYTTQSKLLRTVRGSYGTGNTEHVISRFETTALLVISDLGVSYEGKEEGALLYDILSTRYSNRLPTIISTNMNIVDPEVMKKMLGERLRSRITESIFSIITCNGDDYRKHKRQDYFKD